MCDFLSLSLSLACARVRALCLSVCLSLFLCPLSLLFLLRMISGGGEGEEEKGRRRRGGEEAAEREDESTLWCPHPFRGRPDRNGEGGGHRTGSGQSDIVRPVYLKFFGPWHPEATNGDRKGRVARASAKRVVWAPGASRRRRPSLSIPSNPAHTRARATSVDGSGGGSSPLLLPVRGQYPAPHFVCLP